MPELTGSDLVNRFAAGNGALFVGAGLSMTAGMDSWAELIEPLKREIPGCPNSASYPEIAQYYIDLRGRSELVSHLMSRLKSVRPSEAHYALLDLDPTRIYTTNFDNLLERAAESVDINYHVIVSGDYVSGHDSRLEIVKLHGDLAHQDRLVIAADDYDSYLNEADAIADMLKLDLAYRSPLFLGYSFSDPNLRSMLGEIRRRRSIPPQMYTLQINPTDIAKRWFDKRGVSVIELKVEERTKEAYTRELVRFLRNFRAAVQRRRDEEPASSAYPALAEKYRLPSRPNPFFGREGDVLRLMAALRTDAPLIAVRAPRGTGKRSLALEVAHCCSGDRCLVKGGPCFEHVVWISAEDEPNRRYWFENVLDAVLAVIENRRIPRPDRSHEQKVIDAEAALSKRATLILIDEFDRVSDRNLVAWLACLPAPSRAIVLLRGTALEGALEVEVGQLPDADAIALLRRASLYLGLLGQRAIGDTQLGSLVRRYRGDLRAMTIALGQMSAGATLTSTRAKSGRRELLAQSFQMASAHARTLVKTLPVFVAWPQVPRGALIAASGLDNDKRLLEEAVRECIQLGFFEPAEGDGGTEEPIRYVILPEAEELALQSRDRTFESHAKGRLIAFYLSFLREKLVREEPPVPYWNVLVSDRMLEVDREWPAIREVLRWAEDEFKDEETIVVFTLLLVHYLDSRLLNSERTRYVKASVRSLRQGGDPQLLALLLIDALGWTAIEHGELEEAESSIEEGVAVAERCPPRQRDDLLGLAHSWKSRIALERGEMKAAQESIAAARALQVSPWIEMRTNMCLGDLALRERDGEAALVAYRRAEQLAASYGGEGHGYQILPRIGFALLTKGDLAAAEAAFEELASSDDVAAGRIYARSGLAALADARGRPEESHQILVSLDEELSSHDPSGLLARMIREFMTNLEKRG